MTENPYEIAKALYDHSDVNEVRASHRRITVAHVPDDRHAESIPEALFDHVQSVIEDTMFQWEYSDEPSPELVEKHDVTGGVFRDPIAAGHPELQVLLIR